MPRWSILGTLMLPTLASATEVNINTSSGSAVVLIDEYVKGETPVTTDVDPGQVLLAFRSSMFGPVLFSKEVEIPASGSITFTVDLDDRTVESEGGRTASPAPEPALDPEPASEDTRAKIVADEDGLSIEIDGKDTGEKTPATVSLDPGKHVVKISNGCMSGEEQFTAAEGVLTPVDVEVTGSKSMVEVNSEPEGATLFVDGKELGSTPMTAKISCGEHTLKLTLEGYGSKEQTIDVGDDDLSLTLELPKNAFGSLEVDVDPSDAVIKLDGDRVGTGQVVLDKVTAGEHVLTIERNGVELERRTVNVKDGGSTMLSLVVSSGSPKPTKLKKPKGDGPSASRILLNTLVTAGGVPLVILGTYNYGQARVAFQDYENKLDDFEATGDDAFREEADRIFTQDVAPRQTVAFAEWGAGGALLVGGTALWITSLLDGDGNVHVAPTPRGFVLSGKF